VCDLLTEKDKEYEAVLLLGTTTDTQDITGTVLRTADVKVSEEAVREAVLSFVGSYEQIPPMYSALKVDGKKLCDLARAGVTVERKARTVEIYRIEILSVDIPRVHFRVHCSKGTYIRTLCQDIGEQLGCGGCMESLLRTRVAQFSLANALKLSEVEEHFRAGTVSDILCPVDAVFAQYPAFTVAEGADKLLFNGNCLPAEFVLARTASECGDSGTIRMYDRTGGFVGLYAYRQEKNDYKPIRIFTE
jgi:tRNA pseudouridine55 synthase